MLGTYFFKWATQRYPVLVLEPRRIAVEIVAETTKSYRVKYLTKHPDGSAVGSLHWVSKDKVTITPQTAVNKLPYKD